MNYVKQWRDLPVGIQAQICSYLSTADRGIWAPGPWACVRFLQEPTTEWFLYNPDCTLIFLDWLVECCRRYRCLCFGSGPANTLSALVISFWGSKISVKLYLEDKSGRPETETFQEHAIVLVGKKNLAKMFVVTKHYLSLRVPSPTQFNPLYLPNHFYCRCSNIWSGYVVVLDCSVHCGLWHIGTYSLVREIRCNSEVRCAYILDLERIYLGGEDGAVYTYGISQGMVQTQETLCNDSVEHLLYLGPDQLLVVSSCYQMVLVDTERRLGRNVNEGQEEIHSVGSSRDGSTLVTCDYKGGVRIWLFDGVHVVPIHQRKFETGKCTCAVSPEGSTIMIMTEKGDDKKVFVLQRSNDYVPVLVRTLLTSKLVCFRFDPTSSFLACAEISSRNGYCGSVCLVDAKQLMSGAWVTLERVWVPYPKELEFIDSTRLFVLSSTPDIYLIEWFN